MPLNMLGFIDQTFESVPATRYSMPGGYDGDGIWQSGASVISSHKVNVQPLSDKEIQNLIEGGERLVDARRIYVNDGDLYSISPSDEWQFTGIDGRFKQIKTDNRPWRNYCKITVSKIDDGEQL